MKNLSKISAIATLLLPSFALAAVTDFTSLLNTLSGWLSAIIPVLIAFALVYFIWGVVKYVMAGSDDITKAQAKTVMIHGIIGLFVMVSVWGLVNVLINSFGLSNTVPSTPTIPTK